MEGMKSLPCLKNVLLVSALVIGASISAHAQRSFNRSYEGSRGGSVSASGEGWGRYRTGSVDATGPNGGTYDASGTRYGRYGTGSASATGPNGGTYDASATRYGRYGTGSVSATGANGATYSASASGWTGYRAGYVYTGGVYRPAPIAVNSTYVAPLGAYAGYNVIAQPTYVSHPVYATYPVEISVQIELKRRGYYSGPVDGQIGPGTQKAIAHYQVDAGLKVTGKINKALLVSLGIAQP